MFSIGETSPKASLPIVNPNFEPIISREDALQGAATRTVEKLGADLNLAQKMLTPKEASSLAENPWLARRLFGKAAERSLAYSSQMTGLFDHTGDINLFIKGGADFTGRPGTPWVGLRFQMTTYKGYLSHLRTSPPGTIFILYDMPLSVP
jgi:hypothetical protein